MQRARREQKGRNLATKALGYATDQEHELRRVLADGRLPLDNTRAERSLRKIVVGRKNWMFYGSDSHAESAAAIFSLIASCRLHSIDPQQYLDESHARAALLAQAALHRARAQVLAGNAQQSQPRRARSRPLLLHAPARRAELRALIQRRLGYPCAGLNGWGSWIAYDASRFRRRPELAIAHHLYAAAPVAAITGQTERIRKAS